MNAPVSPVVPSAPIQQPVLPRIQPIHHAAARALLATFRPRPDVYAERLDTQREVDKLNHWCRENGFKANHYLGEWRPKRRTDKATGERAFVPLTVDVVAQHVAGLRTVGFYPLHADDTCNSVSVDFDNHRGSARVAADPMEDARAVAAACGRAGIRCLVNVSRGGNGSWLHVLPPRATPAWLARSVLLRVLRDAGVRHVDEGGTFDALFPKQDKTLRRAASAPSGAPGELVRADIGNLFCAPINGRWLRADPPGTHFFNTDPTDLGAQIRALTEY